MGRKLLVWLIAAALIVAVPVIGMAQAQEKSWDVKGEYLYGIVSANDGYMTVTEQEGEFEFGWAHLWSAERYYPEDMRGEWTIEKLDGDEMKVEIGSDGSAGAGFIMLDCKAGQTASYRVKYSSDELQNDVCHSITVTVVAAADFATGYAYDKTEHETKTGKWYTIPAGHVLPAGAELLRPIVFEIDAGEAWELGEINLDAETGAIDVCMRQAGVYTIKVFVTLMDDKRFEFEHTVNVSGAPTDGGIPDELEMWLDRDYSARLYNDGDDGDKFITAYHLGGDWAWRDDEIIWSLEQTGGEKVDAFLRNYGENEEDKFNGELMVRGPLPIGGYEFKVSVQNVTRELDAGVKIKLDVEEDPGVRYPDNIYYKKIQQGDTVTVKAGQTLKFGKPILYPKSSTVPEDHSYGVGIDGYDGDVEEMIVVNDAATGAHILKGVKEGTYTVNAGLDMMGSSRGTGMNFTLVVEPAGAKVESITLDKNGDWDNPYYIVLGKPTKIKATVLPKNAKVKALKWESEWEEGVSVNDKGVVTGNIIGAQTGIRVRSTDGTNIEQYIVVRVVEQAPIKISMPKKLNMKVGDIKTLKVKLKPAGIKGDMATLIWESDNSAVAEVGRNSGEIIANAPGVATIYAYAMHGDYELNKDVYAICKVTVK